MRRLGHRSGIRRARPFCSASASLWLLGAARDLMCRTLVIEHEWGHLDMSVTAPLFPWGAPSRSPVWRRCTRASAACEPGGPRNRTGDERFRVGAAPGSLRGLAAVGVARPDAASAGWAVELRPRLSVCHELTGGIPVPPTDHRGRETPTRRAISAFGRPSAANTTTRARCASPARPADDRTIAINFVRCVQVLSSARVSVWLDRRPRGNSSISSPAASRCSTLWPVDSPLTISVLPGATAPGRELSPRDRLEPGLVVTGRRKIAP